jgi:excisionase family DNA binding protein
MKQATYYSDSEAARELRVSPSTVWRWIEAGTLPAQRVGPKVIRIRRDDLERMIRPVERRSRMDAVQGAKSVNEAEIARRKALVAEILALREQLPIAPLTASDLIAKVREEEQ